MRRIPTLLAAMALCGGMVAALPAPAAAAPEVRAEASWSMVPQSKDVDRDGVIDGDGGVPATRPRSLQPGLPMVGAGNRVAQPSERLIAGALSWYVPDRGFPVRLDACGSTGDEARWRIDRDGRTAAVTAWRPLDRCRSTVRLPEGDYRATLQVRAGGRRDEVTLPITVRNILVVVLGDSYASGEGNPRNVGAWLRTGGALDPYWDDAACRRSARGAPARAALMLENATPRTSVTLLDLACSGATVDRGILGPQRDAGQPLSQVEQATVALGAQAADLVVLSVGGNDVGFGSILQSCATREDCPLASPPAGPLSGAATVHDGVQRQTAGLPDDYRRIAACLGAGPCILADGRVVDGIRMTPGARVLPTLYPDITRATTGAPCSYLTITAPDFAWARATILEPRPPAAYPYPVTQGGIVPLSVAAGSLNAQIAATGALPAWSPVLGTWTASGSSPAGHGVCAEDPWVFGFTGFTALPSASFHPNPAGQVVLATAIAQAAQAALGGQ